MLSRVILCQFLISVVNAGDCHPPTLPGGYVTGQTSGDSWVGTFTCKTGSSLVGQDRLKCRGGVWSSQFPVCTAIGKCDPSQLPGIENGKKQAVRKFRRSVFKFACNRGFDLVGQDLVYCMGESWSIEKAPLCTKLGCDEGKVANIEHGVSSRLHGGAVYAYSCSPGTVLRGSQTIVCDGTRWNDTVPVCLTGPESVTVSGSSTISLDRVEVFKCTTSVSKKPGKVQWQVTDSGGVDVPNTIQKTNSSISWTESGSVTTSYATVSLSSPLAELTVQCSSSSTDTGEDSVVDMMQVEVQFSPKHISMEAPHSVHSGHSVTALCFTSPSMPASTIHWVVEQGGNTERREPEQEISQASAGGFVTTSRLTVTAGKEHQLLLECYAAHTDMGDELLAYAHVVEVLSPPGIPTIHGLDENTPIILGSQVSLYCSAMSGNPPARLTWHRGREVLESYSEVVGETVTAHVTFAAGPDEEITCEASNDAAKGSLRRTINTHVVPPSTTTTQPTTTITTTATRTNKPRDRVMVKAARRRQKLYDRPAADMPDVEDDDYDYSHFNYLNDQFEETYKETLEYTQEYYEEDYDYVEDLEETEVEDNNQYKEVVKDDATNNKGLENFLFDESRSSKHSCKLVMVMITVQVMLFNLVQSRTGMI